MGTWFLCVILICKNQTEKDMRRVLGLYSNLFSIYCLANVPGLQSSLPGYSQQSITISLTVTLQIAEITQRKAFYLLPP